MMANVFVGYWGIDKGLVEHQQLASCCIYQEENLKGDD